ncbi:DUF5360 family protein [Brevibacillus migulae]|uniref:DUF5360 family protein n=1 Tax=Brevibacillus migulae TaxID=1644114 RepID=UPI00106E119D|nr:DUF5360 family protein [Brevibacillus migulae]
MKGLQAFFWFTDIGFLLYWTVTFLGLIPPEYLYQDYRDPNLIAWNLSFLPLDLLISITGLASLYAYRKGRKSWQPLALVSLVLTFCSGLQAIAFWTFAGDFDPAWWIPNLYLLLYPLWFLPRFLRGHELQTKCPVN